MSNGNEPDLGCGWTLAGIIILGLMVLLCADWVKGWGT